ncbi:vWA domain-containing protein [Caldanaerobius polysaccharolyticus]|uniref:vWA domain-containing protein n=1 Tax=Caldanaerobius polysaccharolyticus TaxID=44256 RepID=UPI00047D9926|nr:VWA domain-containing protein [Caldanaerobius polysaccharolyticus]
MPLKLMTVVTDGKSNIGGSPVEAARDAKKAGIVVNAIGIVDSDSLGVMEVKEIARAGGGLYELTRIEDLSETMQALTQRSVQMTIEEIVNSQIKNIIGKDLKDINPLVRSQVAEYVESLSDETDVEMVILLDTSGSMLYKIQAAKSSVIDLLNTLSGRKGRFSVALLQFPGPDSMVKVLCDFTFDPLKLKEIVTAVGTGGNTPTAIAIREAVSMLVKQPQLEEYTL